MVHSGLGQQMSISRLGFLLVLYDPDWHRVMRNLNFQIAKESRDSELLAMYEDQRKKKFS